MSQESSGWSRLKEKSDEIINYATSIGRLRTLIPTVPEPNSPLISGLVDLTHNDYLGLRVNSTFQSRCRKSIEFLPVGAGASRLLGGEHPIFSQLEEAFSDFKEAKSSLYFPSGYAANEAVATTLAMPGVSFFSDSLNHASIIDGMKLANFKGGEKHIYRHCDLNHLEELLSKSTSEINVIYTESIFSMDGDIAPLIELKNLAQKFNGVLVVDEAHGIGVFGRHGQGLIAQTIGSHEEIISINTCGKALACQGALVCGPRWFRDLLINKARPFIYTTAPSPWIAAALIESIAFVRSLSRERERLHEIAASLRSGLHNLGFDTGKSESQIIPVILGDDTSTLQAQESLKVGNILCKAIRPPTVPEGQSRLRISLSSLLSKEHIETLIEGFSRI